MGYAIATYAVGKGYNAVVYEIVGWDKNNCGEETCCKPAMDCPKFTVYGETLTAAIKRATQWIESQERT
jgi:hypothetical protein